MKLFVPRADSGLGANVGFGNQHGPHNPRRGVRAALYITGKTRMRNKGHLDEGRSRQSTRAASSGGPNRLTELLDLEMGGLAMLNTGICDLTSI